MAALGLKANVCEADHPLVCEGIRRQRGELACALLLYYKDDTVRLEKVRPHSVHCDRKSALWNGFIWRVITDFIQQIFGLEVESPSSSWHLQLYSRLTEACASKALVHCDVFLRNEKIVPDRLCYSSSFAVRGDLGSSASKFRVTTTNHYLRLNGSIDNYKFSALQSPCCSIQSSVFIIKHSVFVATLDKGWITPCIIQIFQPYIGVLVHWHNLVVWPFGEIRKKLSVGVGQVTVQVKFCFNKKMPLEYRPTKFLISLRLFCGGIFCRHMLECRVETFGEARSKIRAGCGSRRHQSSASPNLIWLVFYLQPCLIVDWSCCRYLWKLLDSARPTARGRNHCCCFYLQIMDRLLDKEIHKMQRNVPKHVPSCIKTSDLAPCAPSEFLAKKSASSSRVPLSHTLSMQGKEKFLQRRTLFGLIIITYLVPVSPRHSGSSSSGGVVLNQNAALSNLIARVC